ncbi:ATP-binding protein [Nonomuraea sp. LPB2021202275-12-8]|uniref:ATP-binding protein n=1 Tax=Nonomuraea sp. LPB2021202275-12-8 TaxID=3120159 RepID=UPI00300CA8C8
MTTFFDKLIATVHEKPAGQASWTFPPEAASVPRARHRARAQVGRWGFHDQAEVVELLVSELVTNALRHGRGGIRLGLTFEDGLLRCEVEDEAVKPPSVRPVRADDTQGRGLHLVDMLACCWGSDVTARGKTVWFELAVPVRERVWAAVGVPASEAY